MINAVTPEFDGLSIICVRMSGGCVHLCRADCLTKLTGNAAFLPIGIAAEGVFATEAGRQGPLLKGVVDGGGFTEHVA